MRVEPPATEDQIKKWQKDAQLPPEDVYWGSSTILSLIARIEKEQKRADEAEREVQSMVEDEAGIDI